MGGCDPGAQRNGLCSLDDGRQMRWVVVLTSDYRDQPFLTKQVGFSNWMHSFDLIHYFMDIALQSPLCIRKFLTKDYDTAKGDV